MSNAVTDHYSSTGIVARILAAIPFSRDGDAALRAEQLYPFDQFHGRELLATRDHTALLAPRAGDHVLDIGAGIGGPARYIAATYGARVTGVDLTPRFVEAATELTALCGLDDRATFTCADAAHLPFDDNQFDAAICFYVGMNLPDEPAVLAETRRVLKPGGRLVWTEAVRGAGDALYPQPWAASADASHLLGQNALLGMLQTAGLMLDDARDETQDHLDLAQKIKQSGVQPSPLQLEANAVVLGPDFVERRKNYIRSLASGAIASLCIQAHKPATA